MNNEQKPTKFGEIIQASVSGLLVRDILIFVDQQATYPYELDSNCKVLSSTYIMHNLSDEDEIDDFLLDEGFLLVASGELINDVVYFALNVLQKPSSLPYLMKAVNHYIRYDYYLDADKT